MGLFKKKPKDDGTATASMPPSPAANSTPASPSAAEAEKSLPEEDKDLSLQVCVKQASGIAITEKGGFYCFCEEEPKDYSYSDFIKKKPSFQTPVKRIKKDPVWDFNSTFAGFDMGDKLKFKVRSLISEDIKEVPSDKDAVVGEVTLDTGSYREGFAGELDLKQDGKTVGTLSVEVTPCRRYEVTIVSAKGLRDADWAGKSDPYCICEVPGRPDTRVETSVSKGSTNPDWNKKFEVDVAPKDSLVFELKDRDWPKGDDPLGSVTLTGEQILKGFDDEIEIDDPSQKRGSPAKLKIIIKRISSAEHADAEAKKAAASKIQAMAKGRAARNEQQKAKEKAKKEEGKGNTGRARGWKSKADDSPEATDAKDGEKASAKDVKIKDGKDEEDAHDDGKPKKPRTTALQITIISAESLKETEGKKPQPYCVCSLTGSEKEFFRTKAQSGATSNPKFDFQGAVAEIGPQDSLDFTLKDAAAHDHLLGKATLEASKFNPMGFNGELTLAFSGMGKKAKVKLKVTLVKPGTVEAQVKAQVKKPKPTGPWCFMVKLKSAHCERIKKEDKPKKRGFAKKLEVDLRDKSAAELANEANQENPWMGMDTYAVCKVPGKEEDTMVVTRVIMNAFAPEWEEEYMIRNWKQGEDLEFSVWDYEPPPAKDQLLAKVLLPASAFQEEGFEGNLELEEEDKEEGKEVKFRSLINVQIYMLGATPEKQAKLMEASKESYQQHIERKDTQNKVRIAPGEVLRPQLKSVFQRLYQDHSDRAQKKRAAKEVFWESQQKILDALIESTCRTANSKEIKEISKRLFEDGEIRRKKREEWIEQRHEQVLSELRLVPEISAFASKREEGDAGEPRYEYLFAAAQRAEQYKEKLREQQKEKEESYLVENSVHANLEPQGDEGDYEVFERLFGDGYQRKERLEDRLRDAKMKEEEALFGRVVIDDPVMFNQIVDESSSRLHGEHAKRLQRIEERKTKLAQIQEFQSGQLHQKKPGVKRSGSRTRFHMLYIDSLRRMEQQRLIQEKSERDKEQEIKDMQIFKSPPPIIEDTPANDELDRIFGQLYNPEIRGKLTLGESPGAKASDSDESDGESRKKKTKQKASKSSSTEQDDSSTPRKNKSSKSPKRKGGDDSGSDDDSKPKSGRGKDEKSKQRSSKNADDKKDSKQKASSKSREDSTDSKRKKDDKTKGKPKTKARGDSDSDDGKTSKNKSKGKSNDRGRKDSDSDDGKASKQKSRTSHGKSRGRADSDSDDSVRKGKAAASSPKVRKGEAPSNVRKSGGPGTKSEASRSKTPPPRSGATGKAPAQARSKSTPAGKDGRSKTPPPTAEQLGSRRSVTNLTPEQKHKKAERRRKAETMLRNQEVDGYTLQGWHPAYRHSLLLRVDPAHRAKVEADLDFREMMSRVPIQNREFCKKCQALFSPDAAFCRRCGTKREGGPEPAQPQVHPLVRMAEALKKKNARAAEHFGKFDTNGNGRIAVKEFRQGIEELGLPMYYEDLRKLMVEVDIEGNSDGCVTIPEIEQALRKAEKMASRRKSELFQNTTSSGPRRGTIAVATKDTTEGTAESLMSTQPARAITPSQTAKRRSVTGSPSDQRKSLLRHMDEDDIIRDEQLLIPRTTWVRQDQRKSVLPPEVSEVLPPGTKWDQRPLRERSNLGDAWDLGDGDGDATSLPALNDEAIAALDKDVERELMLALEENIISGLNDSSINRIEPTPIPKALQGLVQNLGDYYLLKFEVEDNDDETVKITLHKTEESRLRGVSLSKMWKDRDQQNKNQGGSNEKPTTPRSKDGAKRPSGASKQSGGDGKKATTPRSSNSKDGDKKTPRSNNSKDKDPVNEN